VREVAITIKEPGPALLRDGTVTSIKGLWVGLLLKGGRGAHTFGLPIRGNNLLPRIRVAYMTA